MSSCCTPDRGVSGASDRAPGRGGEVLLSVPSVPPAVTTRSTRGQVCIPGGQFAMGDHHNEGYPADGETPVHQVTLSDFWMDTVAVTNAAFATFVKATGYRTAAEREGYSAVFHLHYNGAGSDVLGRGDMTWWWLGVAGASWRHPEGVTSDISRRSNHPVVHVSHADAMAYCAWAGKRLPTEAEWEHAARGGLTGARYAWGDELMTKGKWRANIFQGDFPNHDTAEDGWSGTAPVKSFQPNGYGLHQMAGNVWEWCADWFDPGYYAHSPARDPSGAAGGQTRVMRGGSFLCHDSYCNRYRVAARSSSPEDATASNLGFRCANDAITS